MTQQAENMSSEVAPASKYPPQRRRQNDPPPGGHEAFTGKAVQALPPETTAPAPQQLMTPYALQIAAQLDKLERERADAISERNECRARIEQFESRQKELIREKEMLEVRIADQQRATEMERNERIRLSDAMHSVILLLQQKLPTPTDTKES